MMNSTVEAVVTILTAVVFVAILAVLVSKKTQTANVIQAAGSAFGNILSVAVSPATGVSPAATLGYPSSGFGTL